MFPKTGILSWNHAMSTIWWWLADRHIEDTHKVGLMPNITVNWHELPRSKDPDTKEYHIMHAENLMVATHTGSSEKPINPNVLKPRIVVYHKALMSDVKHYWHGHAPLIVYQTLMAHTLLHEMMHYVTLSKHWLAMFSGENENEAYDRFVNHLFYEIGSADNEVVNERITLRLLKLLMLDGLKGMEGLTPTLCGNYDLFKRSRDPEYKRRMDAYEVSYTMGGGYYFDDDDGIDMDSDIMFDRAWLIIEQQEKEARDEHVHVVVVD